MTGLDIRDAGSDFLLRTVKLSELTLRDDIDDDSTDALLILRNSDANKGYGNLNDVMINVHSGILRVASLFFMRGFDKLRPSEQVDKNGKSRQLFRYKLFTPHPHAVLRIVYYIYRNDYQNVKEDTKLLVPMYQESSRLGIEALKSSVLRIIRSQQSLEVLANLSYAADSSGEVDLSKDCGRILADSAYAVFSGKLLERMGVSAVKSLLESDNIQLDEVQTFTALCHYLGSNLQFTSPYSSGAIGTKERDFLKHVRFCSMSPRSIEQLRHENLNSFLLDATLRLLRGTPRKGRHTPWTSNQDYACVTYNGLFPVLVVRGQKANLASFHPNTGNRKLVTPLIANSHNEGPSWSFTVGTERDLSVCSWSYEVAKTRGGNIALGVSFASCDPIDESSRTQFNSMGNNRRVVLYYDFGEDAFKSGYVNPGVNRQIKAPWTYDSSARSPRYKLRQRDIVTVSVCVTAAGVCLAVEVLETTMKREFQMPHRSNATLGTIIRKPCIFGAPFLILHDLGDSLSIPELRAEYNV